MTTYLWIGLGGFLGANARYLVQNWATVRWGANFPYGTLLANVSGAFLLTVFATLGLERLNISPEIRLFVATGFLGGYTTFSSWGYESLRLLEVQGWWSAGLNFLGNVILGALAILLGLIVARWLEGVV